MSRRWGRIFGLRDRSVLEAEAAFAIYEEPEFAPSDKEMGRRGDGEMGSAPSHPLTPSPPLPFSSDGYVSSDLAGPWTDEIADLRKELSKIGKAQFRARAVTESALEAIQQTLEAIQVTLKPLSLPSRKEEAAGLPAKSDDWIKDLLTVADGLEEAIRAGEAMRSGPDAAWTDGIRIVHRRVCEILEKENVRPVASVGERFDPHLHIAVEVEPASQVAENVITEEHRKGYRRGDQVLRFAEVVVAKREENQRRA